MISRITYAGVACGMAACISGLVAQPASLNRMVWRETGRVRFSPSPTAGRAPALQDLPKQFSADRYSSGYARRRLIPSMGGSIAVGDFDGDGRPDFYVTRPGGANTLWRNDGDGAFRDVTAKARVPGLAESLSATFSDYDRSGRLSLFVAGVGGVALYHNDGDGTFSDRTQQSGVRCKPGEVVTRAVLADADGDGFPDLLLTIYTDLDHPPAKTPLVFPNDFSGAGARFYHNNGHGAFTEAADAADLSGNPGRARNALFADFNNDGRPDFLILRDDKPPALYLNRGNGHFEDATWAAGGELTNHAFFEGMVADFNGDGKLDLALWSTISFRVLLNRGNAVFERAGSIPMPPPVANLFAFHGLVSDIDGNGTADLLTLEKEGKWHALLNRDGRFEDLPLLFSTESRRPDEASPGELRLAAVCPIRLDGENSLYLLGLRLDGSVMALNRMTDSEK
jgi:hypothetical protein